MNQPVETYVTPHEKVIRLTNGSVIGCGEMIKTARLFKSCLKIVEVSDLHIVKQAIDIDIACIREAIVGFESLGHREKAEKASRALHFRKQCGHAVDSIFADRGREKRLAKPQLPHDGRSQAERERDSARKNVERLKAHIRREEENDFPRKFHHSAKALLPDSEYQRILAAAGLVARDAGYHANSANCVDG